MAIMFVASSLLVRRLPRERMVQLALVWVAIFLAVVAAVRFYESCCAAPAP